MNCGKLTSSNNFELEWTIVPTRVRFQNTWKQMKNEAKFILFYNLRGILKSLKNPFTGV